MYKIGSKSALDVVMKGSIETFSRPVTLEYESSSSSSLDDAVPSISRVHQIVADSVAYIETHGLFLEGVFRVNGDLKKAQQLLNDYNLKSNLNLEKALEDVKDDGSNVRTVASLLKMYFRSMRSPLFPEDIYHDILKHRKDARKLKDIVMRKMPRSNIDALTVIMELCHHISQGSDTNRMTPNALSICWAPSLLRAPASNTEGNDMDMMMGSAMDAGKRNKVIETLISNFDVVFDSSTRPVCRKL